MDKTGNKYVKHTQKERNKNKECLSTNYCIAVKYN